MEYADRVLKCVDCGAEFVFTAGEQLFFHDKQFAYDPRHCKQCKAKRARGGSRVRTETRTRCSQCGAETTVPFKPTQGRPVLCRSCFQQQRMPAQQRQKDDDLPLLESERAESGVVPEPGVIPEPN